MRQATKGLVHRQGDNLSVSRPPPPPPPALGLRVPGITLLRKHSRPSPHNVEKTIQKYQQLAKDAQSTGDPVLIENYLQHADHFGRRLAELNERNKVNTLNEKPNVNNEEATLKEKTEPLEKPKDLPQSSN